MTFLAPSAAIAAAVVGVPVLAAFYLLKLRRRPVRVSSTMLWEQAVKDVQVNVPFRWVRPSLLLLLHAMILALFILALGRPVLDAPAQARSRVVILLDTSASMNARDTAAGPTRLERATERARAVADELSRTARPVFSLVTFAAEPGVAGPSTDSTDLLAAQLEDVLPTDQPGDPDAALQLARSLVGADDSEDEDTPRALVVLISDGGDLAGRPLALAGVDVRFERVGPEPGTPVRNLGITRIDSARDREDPGLARTFVEVVNASPEPTAAALRLLAGDVELDRVPIDVPGAGDASGGRGARTITARIPGAATVRVELDLDDALASDNAAAVAIPPARRPAVLVVAPAGDDGTPLPDPFLADVLAEMDLRQVRTVSVDAYARFESGAGAFDVIVFDRVRAPALPARPSLSFGEGIPGLDTRDAADPQRARRPTTWRRTHALLRDVTLDPLVVLAPKTVPEALDPESRLGALQILARTEAGPLIAEATHAGRTHVVVAFPIASSNWPTHYGFPIFLAGAIETLASNTGAAPGVSFTTTDPVLIPAGADAALAGPVERRALTVSPDGVASFGVLPRAGVYRLAGTPREIPVNLVSERESRLASPSAVSIAGQTLDARDGDEGGPVELWRWLILAALVLLALEWAVYTILARA